MLPSTVMNNSNHNDPEYQAFLDAIESIDEKAISEAKELGPEPSPNRSAPIRTIKVDLHRQTVSEAKQSIFEVIRKNSGSTVVLEIVTGKGRHSGSEGGVLFKEIYQFVSEQLSKYIVEIDDPPEQGMFRGMPLRGKFNVKLKLPQL